MVSRSGAGTVAEVTALGKPAVFVPLATSAGDEQVHNARHLADAGTALALTGDVTAERLEAARWDRCSRTPRGGPGGPGGTGGRTPRTGWWT